MTSARKQLKGVKLTSSGKGGGGGGGGTANREKDSAADDRKLRAVHGEEREMGGERDI